MKTKKSMKPTKTFIAVKSEDVLVPFSFVLLAFQFGIVFHVLTGKKQA